MKDNKVIALGCRLNIFEAELIKEQAKKAGLNNTIIVNTCTVTQEAQKKSLQTIRKLKKENPNSMIIVTGCGAEIDPSTYANMPEVNKVIGNKDKFSLDTLLSPDKLIRNDINNDGNIPYEIPKIQGFENKTRAFIQIQQGCDHKCSFCIIHQARGKSRSVSKNNIIAQIKQSIAFGHKDIVLTGVDISSWNRDALSKEPSQIGKLCMDIFKEVPELSRLRLSSLDPAVEDENILSLLKHEEKFMPHLHLSLQAMNSKVLANMGRRHSKESAISWIHTLREAAPNIAFGADIISGFPRESEEQFLDTYETIKHLKIPFLHVFPYSEREGTIAVKMTPIPVETRKSRANSLSKLGENIKSDFFAQKLGNIEEVLVETNNLGYTRDYSLVKIESERIIPRGEIIKVKITNQTKKNLIANLPTI